MNLTRNQQQPETWISAAELDQHLMNRDSRTSAPAVPSLAMELSDIHARVAAKRPIVNRPKLRSLRHELLFLVEAA